MNKISYKLIYFIIISLQQYKKSKQLLMPFWIVNFNGRERITLCDSMEDDKLQFTFLVSE